MKISQLVILLALVLIGGCTPSGKTFYWGTYSSTLYELKKSPDEKTLEAHKKSLILIMEESNKKKMRIPPGVYAEYGYILLRSGSEVEGLAYLDKEIELYPESIVFIKRIKSEYARRHE